MSDPHGFLFELLAARRNPHAPAEPLAPRVVAHVAHKHHVDLPDWDDSDVDELEDDTATDALQALRTQLTDSLVGEDASAGREVLNAALAAWSATVVLEEELGPDERPAVQIEATVLPPVPLRPWYERKPELPRGMAERCPTVATFVLAVASVLLTEATNVHLSGHAERVRACEAPDCRTPFMDASDAARRRFCSARCRARQSARARAWAQAGGR